MTLLHQAAQKAVEALKTTRRWLPNEDGYTAMQVESAITDLESALQQQPEPVAKICDLVVAQFNSTDPTDPYMRGLFNGLELALATLENRDPAYLGAPPALQHQEVPREPVARWHELKTDPDVFDAVADGRKTFEIRLNDRDFRVGDGLLLRRTRDTGWAMKNTGAPLTYTGEELRRVVSHVLHGPVYGLAEGWAILSFAASPSTTQQQEVGSGDIVTLGGGIPGDPSGELTAICKGLVSAVAYGENREVSALFDTPGQAHAFVRYLQRFVGNGVAASPSTPERAEKDTSAPSGTEGGEQR